MNASLQTRCALQGQEAEQLETSRATAAVVCCHSRDSQLSRRVCKQTMPRAINTNGVSNSVLVSSSLPPRKLHSFVGTLPLRRVWSDAAVCREFGASVFIRSKRARGSWRAATTRVYDNGEYLDREWRLQGSTNINIPWNELSVHTIKTDGSCSQKKKPNKKPKTSFTAIHVKSTRLPLESRNS